MTDKQIIIDGVDVSKCKHYDEVFNYCDQSYLGEGGLLKNTKNPKRCECSPNCYYKQLKRKERERKQLKEELKECRIGIIDMSIESTEICKISEKYKRALDEIEKYLDIRQKYFDGEDYHNLLDIINKAKGANNDRQNKS